MRVTVLLPCRNEAQYIGPCLDSIIATNHPHQELEVLVIDGLSDDATRDIVGRYAAQYPWIHLRDNPKRIVPTALNIGIAASTGEVIVRVDAHALYPPDYIPRLVEALAESGADNVGGCIVTVPADGTPEARAIALALAHPFGVGNSYFRIGTAQPKWVDTVPYGCYRRDVFKRVGLFDEELVRNQDEEFNYRLLRAGGRILLLPTVISYYYPRRSRRLIARMHYQYGFFKPMVARKIGRVVTVRQLIPPAFVAAVATTALLSLVWWPAAALLSAITLAYTVATLVAVIPSIREHGMQCSVRLATVFPIMHASYGWGFIRGLSRALARRPRWTDPTAVPLTR